MPFPAIIGAIGSKLAREAAVGAAKAAAGAAVDGIAGALTGGGGELGDGPQQSHPIIDSGTQKIKDALNGTTTWNGEKKDGLIDKLGEKLLSDEDLKEIKDKLSTGKMDKSAVKKMLKAFSVHMDDKGIYEARNAHQWRDDVLDGYINYIKNYHYNYKPESVKVDPEIDPNVEHIGIMAQDLEKVNPACIIEDDRGFKKVDTGRLALMNAGAIAELARIVKGKEGKNASKR